MSEKKIATWRELADRFPKNSPADFLDAVRRATAPKRHNARVQVAVRAALDAAVQLMGEDAKLWLQMYPHNLVMSVYVNGANGGEYEYPKFMQRPEYYTRPLDADHDVPGIASMLCLLEAQGTGGPGNMGIDECGRGDRSTVRAEWARKLGKGRAHASDGPAWTAAIRDAGNILRDWRHCQDQDELLLSVAASATDPTLKSQLRSHAIRRAAKITWAIVSSEELEFLARLWTLAVPAQDEAAPTQDEAVGEAS